MSLKTLEEHIFSTEQMAKMAFFYAARWMKRVYTPEKNMGEILSCHTPLLFHGLNYTLKEEWNNIELAGKLLEDAGKFADYPPEEFENIMWQNNKDAISARAAELYPHSRGMGPPPSWNCGSLKYDPPNSENPRRVSFHIYNTVSPHSFFRHPDYLILCFLLLMREAELRYGADTLFCSSWLNDHPRWLEFFPAEWQENLSPRATGRLTGMTVGDWGSIYDARGCMNEKHLTMVRETGKLPYVPRKSFCSFQAMRRHLAQLNQKMDIYE